MSAGAEKDGIPVGSAANVRLELLRLAHQPGKDAADVIKRAEEYEEYVLPKPAVKRPAAKAARARKGKATPRADSK